VGPMHQDLVAETFRAASAESDAERTREMRRAVGKLVRTGRAEGDVTQLHAVDDLVTLILGALSQLLFEWANRIDVSIADRATRMARLLANALAPQSERRTTRSSGGSRNDPGRSLPPGHPATVRLTVSPLPKVHPEPRPSPWTKDARSGAHPPGPTSSQPRRPGSGPRPGPVTVRPASPDRSRRTPRQ
jgi:hypothetical protein